MYTVSIEIRTNQIAYTKTFSAEDKEEAETYAGQALGVLRQDGFLDDEESEWIYIPAREIIMVGVKFTEIKESDDDRSNG